MLTGAQLDPQARRLSLGMPVFTLSTIHVLASRVKLGLQLRVVGLNPQRDDVSHLTSLLHPPCLGIWQASYDDDGQWHAPRCADAVERALGGRQPMAGSCSRGI